MTDSDLPPVSLAVLNPKGRDPFLDFQEPPAEPVAGVHAPINFHAYAAATKGCFFDAAEAIIAAQDRFDAVLVLIRKRAWISLKSVQQLKAAGLTVIVAWKECSESQIEKQLRSQRARIAYAKLLDLADGILSPTSILPPKPARMSDDVFQKKSRRIPTPYPLEFPGWDFSRPIESRNGIFVGTREFRAAPRNHLRAIEELAELAKRVEVNRITVINTEGKSGSRRLHELARKFPDGVLQIVESALPYPNYMRLLATHRLVFQRDLSGVPGQVAGDCLLARILCAGGNSAIEKIAFEDLSAGEKPMDRLGSVLTDDNAYQNAVAKSQAIAAENLSFSAVANAFADWDILQSKA